MPASSFHYWTQELMRHDRERTTGSIRPRKRAGLGDFVPVYVMAELKDGIEIDPASAVVRVRRGLDDETLARLIHVIRREDSAAGETRSC